MATNRRTRDEILIRALNRADCPTLDAHDRPGGVIQPNAHILEWLQDGLDYIYEVYPWGGLVTSAALTLTSAGSVSAPSDMAIDVRDGLTLDSSKKRLTRIDGQEAVSRQVLAESGTDPVYYSVHGSMLRYYPYPSASVAATLYYHQLPGELAANDVPHFPSALILVEYLRIKAFEWIRTAPANTGETYLRAKASELQKAGLHNSPESNTIPLDARVFRRSHAQESYTAWMGPR